MRKSKKTTRAIFLNAWRDSGTRNVTIVSDGREHRVYYRVTPASFRRLQRAQLALMDKGGDA